MTVMGVDSSTQNCKVVIRDLATGAVTSTGRRPHPDGTEVDPEAWWEALCGAIDDAGGLAGVTAISIGGQQHGMVVLDDRGQVLRPALLWNDTRSADAARQLTDELGAENWAQRSGSVPVASFTATKLRWLADHEPDTAARIAAVCLPHDWLSWRLRGFGPERPELRELTTDRSDASGTSYYDLTGGDWDRELLSLALRRDATRIVLPQILEPWECRPSETHVGVNVAAGAGDNAAAALGVGARDGDVVVSLGTSGTVFASASTPTIDPTGTVACFADATGRYLPIVTTLNAARVLDATARVLGVDHEELARLALDAGVGADGLVLHPYFTGERTPNLPDATATLSGLTDASFTRENLARAAFDGMICALADGVDALLELGVPMERVLLTGGAARSRASQIVAAEVFGVPVVIPEPGEYVALGAAVQAAWATDGTRPEWDEADAIIVREPAVPAVMHTYRNRFARHYA